MTYNFISTVCQNLSRPIVPRLLACSLGVLLVWQWIAGVASIFTLNKTSMDNGNSSAVIHTQQTSQVLNKGLTWPFFGKYVPQNLNDADVRQSMLNFKVVGIMLASPEKDSEVILHSTSGREQTFRVGDKLPGGAMIKRITEDGVLVERKGELESLSFPKNELIFGVQAKPLKDKVDEF